jgi:serine phosphatase RsbU (regulator of sigma subunit)
MLVALIVGAVRTAFLHSKDPLQLMNILNERLCDRGSASATCLVLRIEKNGQVTLANAGHLSPYLNGREMEMEGALPLGVVPEAEFSEMQFTLELGDVLVLMSDGIAEAQDEDRNLFGFERVGKMLEESVSAATLAAAAQQFGQEDDILVLRIQRDRAPAVAPPEMELVAGE